MLSYNQDDRLITVEFCARFLVALLAFLRRRPGSLASVTLGVRR